MEQIIYICDKCKNEIKDYSKYEHKVSDMDNHYFYDLCEKCQEDYKEYLMKVEEMQKSIENLTKQYKFGKYAFEVNID
jgi:hypothetical protein